MQPEQLVSIGSLQVRQCYNMQGLMVSSFNSKKYLTPPKSGCTISLQPDIGDVEDEPDEDTNMLCNVEVVGICITHNNYLHLLVMQREDGDIQRHNRTLRNDTATCMGEDTEDTLASLKSLRRGPKAV